MPQPRAIHLSTAVSVAGSQLSLVAGRIREALSELGGAEHISCWSDDAIVPQLEPLASVIDIDVRIVPPPARARKSELVHPQSASGLLFVWDGSVIERAGSVTSALSRLGIPYRIVRPFRYDAFISYRHDFADIQFASRLQRMLERRLLPSAYRRGGWKHLTVFRDDTDLVAATDLPAALRVRLEESRRLIVVCSPSVTASRWVPAEVEHFAASRGAANISYLLVGPDATAANSALAALAVSGTEPLGIDFVTAARSVTRWQPATQTATRAKARLLSHFVDLDYATLARRERLRIALAILPIFVVIAAMVESYVSYRNRPLALPSARALPEHAAVQRVEATPQQPYPSDLAIELPGYVIASAGTRAVTAHRNRLAVWDRGRKVQEHDQHGQIVYGLDIEPGGRFIVSAAEDGAVLVTDTLINATVASFPHDLQEVFYRASFCPDDRDTVVVAGCHGIDAARSAALGKSPSSEGLGLAVAEWNWRLGLARAATVIPADAAAVDALSARCRGTQAMNDVLDLRCDPRNIEVLFGSQRFTVPRGGAAMPVAVPLVRIPDEDEHSIRMGRDGIAVASGSHIEVQSGSETPRWRDDLAANLRVVALDSDAAGRNLFAAFDTGDPNQPGAIRHYRFEEARNARLCNVAAIGGPLSLDYDERSGTVAVGAGERSALAYDFRNCHTDPGDPAWVAPRATMDMLYAAAVAADGTRLAVGGVDGSLWLFDLDALELLQRISSRQTSARFGDRRIVALDFSQRAERVAAVSQADRKIRVWDLTRGIPPQSWAFDGVRGAASGRRTYRRLGNLDVAISPDGSIVAAGDDLGCVHVCQIESGACRSMAASGKFAGQVSCDEMLAEVPEGSDLIAGVGFLDDHHLVTSGHDGRFRRWRVTHDVGKQLTAELESSSRSLTDDEPARVGSTPASSMLGELSVWRAQGEDAMVATSRSNGDVLVWAGKGEPTRVGVAGEVSGSVGFMPSEAGPLVVAAGRHGTVRLWPLGGRLSQGFAAAALRPIFTSYGSQTIKGIAAIERGGLIAWLTRGTVNFGRVGLSLPALQLHLLTTGEWLFVAEDGHWFGDARAETRSELKIGTRPHTATDTLEDADSVRRGWRSFRQAESIN
ncbi:MAG: TIR domain-containing protein [bacterium]